MPTPISPRLAVQAFIHAGLVIEGPELLPAPAPCGCNAALICCKNNPLFIYNG
jgi:hypothetical protein